MHPRYAAKAAALLVCASFAVAADAPNLISNPGFEQGLANWETSVGKGEVVTDANPGAAHAGSKCARFNIDGQVAGLDCAKALVIHEDLLRNGQYVLSAWIKNGGVAKGNWGLRLYYYDDDGYVAMHSGMTLTSKSAKSGWQQQRVALGAGTPRPFPAGAHACKVRFSIWDPSGAASCDVWLDDVSLVLERVLTDERRRIGNSVAVWSDPALGLKPASDPATVAKLLSDAGFKVETLTTDALLKLSAERFGLLVLPYADAYPGLGGNALSQYLSHGGAFVSLAGRAFSRPVFKVGDRWAAADEAGEVRGRVDMAGEWDFTHAGADEAMTASKSKVDQGQAAARFTVAELKGYAYAGAKLPKLPADAEMLVFKAKGDATTKLLCLELQERDGSRWKFVLPLQTEWQEFRVHAADFISYASKGRGTGNDHFHVDKAAGLWFGMTAGMVGKGAHAFELAELRFCRATAPSALVVRSQLASGGQRLAQRYFRSDTTERERKVNVGCFYGTERYDAARLRPVPGQSFVPADAKLDGRFGGWIVTGVAEPARVKGKHRARLLGPSKRESRVVPLLEVVRADGEPEGAAAVASVHVRERFAGSVWAAFGMDNVDVASHATLSEALVNVAKFVRSGVVWTELKPVFTATTDRVQMTLRTKLFNRGAEAVQVRSHATLTSRGARNSSAQEILLQPGRWTWFDVMTVDTKDFDWQRFAAQARLEPVGVTLAASLDTRQALRDVGDFFVKEGADDGKFSASWYFVDQRGARRLLGAYELTGDKRYLQTAINFGKAIVAEQRPDGGYRMGYGITSKGEACYVADGGEIAVCIARLVSYTAGEQQRQFMDSLRRYMAYRDDFRCPGGGIGVGWCFTDYGKRPIPKKRRETPTRTYAPELNTYTIGCTLAAAYAYARLTADPNDERAAEADAEWLMARAKSLSGAFIESYIYAREFTTQPEYRQRYVDYVKRVFEAKMVDIRTAWWLGGAGRSALNLDGLAYCYDRLGRDPKVLAKLIEATYAIFSPDSSHSVYKLTRKEKINSAEWIYLCFSYVSLPDVVKPMITMKPFEPVKP